jgi:hypothetical protein
VTELNIHQRMQAVMRDVRGVAKSQTNTHGGYKYAGHEALTDALRDKYVTHGIQRTATVVEHHRDGGLLQLLVEVTWINVERPEDRYSVRILGESPAVTKSGAASPVQAGIALSYAVKNAEFKAFALTGDDTPNAEENDNQTPEVVMDLLDRYAEAATQGDIDGIGADIRREWERCKEHRQELTEARTAAMRRVGGK